MTACSYPPPYRLRCRSAVRCLRRKALPRLHRSPIGLLTTFCLLAMLAFLSLCDKNHKNSRFFRLSRPRTYFSKNFFNVSKILCSGFKSACAFCFYGAFLWKVRTHIASLVRFCGKCGRILFRRSVFEESASAHCFLGVFLGKVRAHFVSPARFRGKCGRTLLPWRDFEESADAHCLLGAFLEKVRAHFASPKRFRGKCGRILCRSALRCLTSFWGHFDTVADATCSMTDLKVDSFFTVKNFNFENFCFAKILVYLLPACAGEFELL